MIRTGREGTSFAPVPAGAGRVGAEWWRPAPPPGARVGLPDSGSIDAIATGGAAPFVALLAFLIILLLAPQALFPALVPLRLALVAAVGGIAAHALGRFLARRPITIVTREIVLAACLAAWAVLSVPYSYWPGGSLSLLLDLFIKSLAVFWLIANLAGTPARFRALTLTLVIASIPLASVAIMNFLSGDVVPGGASQGFSRIVGYDAPLTKNPNDLALTLNLILPFSVAHLIQARGVFSRAILLGIVVLGAVAVVLTFSRAGFLTLATMLALYLWKLSRSTRRAWAAAVVLLAFLAVPFLPGSYLDHMGTIADMRSDQTGSAQARWGGMVAATKLALEHPLLGVGAGMNILALNEAQGPSWKEVHNVYLEYAADLGLPGLVLFLALFCSCVLRARQAQRAAKGVPGLEDLFHHGAAVEISLVAFGVAGMFHPVGYHFYFFIIAGLAVAIGRLGTMDVLPVTD